VYPTNSYGVLIAGTVAVSDGRSATFRPSSPLSPLTSYSVCATSAIVDLEGQPLPGCSPSYFTTGQGTTTAPVIAWINPNSAFMGDIVTISGSSFGTAQGNSTVTFAGLIATPTNWTDNTIVVPVPFAALTGNVVVTVGGVASNAVNFAVLNPPFIANISP